MPNCWRKLENEDGFPFYFNESSNLKQWDHPKFADIQQRIDDCNYVKYSTYRVALKFRVLQHALYMEDVSLNTIAGVFERHRLGINESSLCLESCDLEAVLSDIYFAANKQNHTNIDIDFATELTQNFIYNVYDKNRKGKIQVSSTKLVLGILSNSTINELNNFIFNLCCDHNNCVTRLRLQSILTKLVEISIFMHEDVNFGQHLVNSSIENCFSNSPGLVGINENNFIFWLNSGPQLLAWLPILRRIKSAEPVVHAVKCSSCKTSPLMGLRYRCMKCTRYTQCQRCFFTGRTSNSHKLSHSMKEYCSEMDNSKELNLNFIKKLCGLLPCSKMNETQVSIVDTKPLNFCDKKFSLKSSSADVLCDIEPLSSPHAQLQIIIKQLEMQNRELHQILLLGSHNENEIRNYLEEHRIHIAAQIHKLKILKDYWNLPDISNRKTLVESTPMIANIKYQKQNQSLGLLSPIIQESDCAMEDSFPQLPSSGLSDKNSISLPYRVDDMSTWIGDHQTTSKDDSNLKGQDRKIISFNKLPVRESHNDLDDALAKLQQILANNFTLDESLGTLDNNHLKHAVSEVEGMLTSIIDTVESSRASSVQPYFLKCDRETDINDE